MQLSDYAQMGNRALRYTRNKVRFTLLLIVLLSCGFLTAATRSLCLWLETLGMVTPMLFPFFLSAGCLFAISIPIMKIYHCDIHLIPYNLKHILIASKKGMLFAFLLSLPLLFIYLASWSLLGLFLVLKETNVFGSILGVLFSFFPFILVFVSILLFIVTFFFSFFALPIIAMEKVVSSAPLLRRCLQRFNQDCFTNLLLFGIAFIPFLILLSLLFLSSTLTEILCFLDQTTCEGVASGFILIIPTMLLITPAIQFLLNFSYETHAFMSRNAVAQES